MVSRGREADLCSKIADERGPAATKTAAMNASYLTKLNPQQRRAVEHGGAALAEAGPLLIIAGAGSGKTNTLAHRVAHLIINGADPRRILLMTFSRRAAAEMTRRVERICAQASRRQGRHLAEGMPGPAPSTPSARSCCANMPSRSGSIPPSPSMTARIPRT